MREIVFKMERPGLVEVGQEVDVSESITPVNVNYMIEPAVAMSGLFRFLSLIHISEPTRH